MATDRKTSTTLTLRKFIESGTEITGQAEEVVVLFADLVGSTEFKMDRMPAEGLRKTALHNETICDALCDSQFGGEIIKLLGDGVLAVFRGENKEVRALDASLYAIQQLETINDKHNWNPEDPSSLATRIGIHIGKVWWFSVPQLNVPDPQGSTVDIAFRIQGLANAQTVATTEELFSKISTRDKYNKTDSDERVLKGVRSPMKVRLVGLPDKPLEDLPLAPNCIPTRADLKPALTQAEEYYHHGEFDLAEKVYREILAKLPTDYRANFRLAKILIRKRTPDPTLMTRVLREARKHLCMTKRLVNDDGRVWILLGWIRFKAFENNIKLTDEATENRETNLELAIAGTQQAVLRAMTRRAHDKLIRAKSQLALLYVYRSREEFGEGQADLDRANTICMEIKAFPSRQLERDRAECLRVQAIVKIELLSKSHDTQSLQSDVKKIDDLLKNAITADRSNSNVDITRAMLKERLKDLGSEDLLDDLDS